MLGTRFRRNAILDGSSNGPAQVHLLRNLGLDRQINAFLNSDELAQRRTAAGDGPAPELRRGLSGGFSLMELIVVIAIFGLVLLSRENGRDPGNL